MTEQPTTIPTPYKDAAKALRERYNAEFAVFAAERTPALNRMTKDEAVDLAVRKYLDEPRSSVSKKMAVEEILNGEFMETEIASETYKAERLAAHESTILRRIAASTESVAYLSDELAEVTASEGLRYQTERLLEMAFRLQRQLLTSNLWERVAQQIGGGMAPVDALARVREQVMQECLSPWNDPMSRSTSLSANLTSDQQQFVKVNWLRDHEHLTRRD